MRVTTDDAACEVLEVIPLVMRVIRSEMREHRDTDLSVPQFRALAYLNRNDGASLSELAEHIGLTLPSMSKLVDGLVGRKLMTRETPAGDRRRLTLGLTVRGRTTLQSAYNSAQAQLAKRLARLSEDDRYAVLHALRALRPLFTQGRAETAGPAVRRTGES